MGRNPSKLKKCLSGSLLHGVISSEISIAHSHWEEWVFFGVGGEVEGSHLRRAEPFVKRANQRAESHPPCSTLGHSAV